MVIKMYKSIKENIESTLTINKSEFISQLFICKTADEAHQIIDAVSKKYKDANHNCYAYIIGKDRNIKKCNDDGEPSQTAGMPILNVLEHNEVTDILCIVTRYFGGIKLGAGGLVRAYSKSCSQALDNAEIVEQTLADIIEVIVDYKQAPKLEHYFVENNIIINEKSYYDKVYFLLTIKTREVSSVENFIINYTANQAIIERKSQTYIAD